VLLAFEDASGAKHERRAIYQIDTQPELAIVRVDGPKP
jgi:hypothetical protein